jgi:hypothetical protein
MYRVPLALFPVLGCALLLTACGSQNIDAQNRGPAGAQASTSTGASGDSSCGTSATPGVTVVMGESPSLEMDGVKTTGGPGCSEFELTNNEAETFTYTVNLTLTSSTGAAIDNWLETVPSVKPGQTVRHTIELPEPSTGAVAVPGMDGQAPTRVQISLVRGVPTAEAPTEAGSCPPSGVRLHVGAMDAAMGLRVVELVLTNCGTSVYHLDGYPDLQLFDEHHEPVDSVKILHGGDAIALDTGADGEPQPLSLKPGESAEAGLVWRNTTGLDTDPVNAPYVRVVANAGAAAVMVTPELDLGTTGKLGIGPWKKDDSP